LAAKYSSPTWPVIFRSGLKCPAKNLDILPASGLDKYKHNCQARPGLTSQADRLTAVWPPIDQKPGHNNHQEHKVSNQK